MPEPKWVSIERIGSPFEEEIDVSVPGGPMRHRRRGTDEWIDGPVDPVIDAFLYGDGSERKGGLLDTR